MTDVQCLIDRQLGRQCRLSYDSALRRLEAAAEEAYYGLWSGGAPAADHDPPIFACRFAELDGYRHILALANEDGRVAIQNTLRHHVGSLEGFQCHNNAVFDLVWVPSCLNFVTVSGDHTACVWDVSSGSARRVVTLAAHTRSVKTAASGAPHLLATGGRDGHVLVWDTRAAPAPALSLRPDNWLAACHAGAEPGPRRARDRALSVTGLAFRDPATLVSCGECDGNIKVWDLRKNYSACRREPLPRHSIPYCGASARHGYTGLVVDDARTRLYASCMDSVIYCFNLTACSPLPEFRYVGHENGSFYVKAALSADGRYLASGSSDKCAYVWSVRRARPLLRLAAHRAEVTCAAWRAGAEPTLATCGDDARHMIWRVAPERDRADPGDEPAGRAELLPHCEPPPAWGTPSALKRAAETTPSSRGAKRSRPAPAPARRTKRCLADMLEAAREPHHGDPAKKPRTAPPEEHPEPAPAPASPPEARPEPAPAPERRPTSPPSDTALRTPTKRAASDDPVSPNKVRLLAWSPPDWVRGGQAPHLRLMSPPRPRAAPRDWLTLLGARSPAPAPLSPRENLPPRRPSCERTPKSAKKTRTLLKYFTLEVKEGAKN